MHHSFELCKAFPYGNICRQQCEHIYQHEATSRHASSEERRSDWLRYDAPLGRSSATLAAASGIVKDDSGCQQFGLQLSLCACGTGCSGERGNLSDRQPCFQRVRSRPDARTAKALAFICSSIIVRSCVQLGTRIRGQKLVLGQPDWQAGTGGFLLPQGDSPFLRYFAVYALWIMSVLRFFHRTLRLQQPMGKGCTCCMRCHCLIKFMHVQQNAFGRAPTLSVRMAHYIISTSCKFPCLDLCPFILFRAVL